MLAANSWRVAVNADAASARRLMGHLQALEADSRRAPGAHADEPERATSIGHARSRRCPSPSSRHCSASPPRRCGTSETGESSRRAPSPACEPSPTGRPDRGGSSSERKRLGGAAPRARTVRRPLRRRTLDAPRRRPTTSCWSALRELNNAGGQGPYLATVDRSRDDLRSTAAAVTPPLPRPPREAHRDHADAHASDQERSRRGPRRYARSRTPRSRSAKRSAVGSRGCARSGRMCCSRARKARQHRSRWRALRYRILDTDGVQRTAVAPAEQSRRHRGARGAVAAGPTVRVGRDRARTSSIALG